MRPGPALLLLFFGALSAPLSGCPDDAVCSDYVPPPSFDTASPAVRFSSDVLPIFANHCALPTCHGSANDANGIFLGGADAAKVRSGIVDVRASELPTMSYVKPGDPRESFLVRKIDGSQCVLSAQCNREGCGEAMPRNGERLPLETRDAIRRWIAQGAKND